MLSRSSKGPMLRLLVLAPLCLAGCSGSSATGAIRTVADSGGIELVTLALHGESDLPLWVASQPPSMTIGAGGGGPSAELHKVRAAKELSDKRLVVANEGTHELKFYRADGTYVGAVGREGSGPGEFESINHLDVIEGDSLLLHDLGNMRLVLLSPEGAFARSMRFPAAGAPVFQLIAGATRHREAVSWALVTPPEQRPGVYAPREPVSLTPLWGDSSRAFATLRTHEEALFMYRGRFARAFRSFGRKGDVTAAGDHIYILQSDRDSEIAVFAADGRQERLIRVDVPRQAVDAKLVDDWVESIIRRYSDGEPTLEAWWRAGFDATPPPANVPVFRSLTVDDAGNVCAERYPLTAEAASVYWCFSSDGELLRRIQLPLGLVRELHPFQEPQLQVGEEFVLGVWADSLGVQSVRRYTLAKEH